MGSARRGLLSASALRHRPSHSPNGHVQKPAKGQEERDRKVGWNYCAHGYSMHQPEAVPRWWDRDVDESGHLLRADVRESAHRVWKSVCAQARCLLGDAADAPELLESAVKAVSRYLDKNDAPLHASDPGGLL